MADLLLKAQNLVKSYPSGSGELQILKGIGIELEKKSAVCIMGGSGAGKSTLLHVLGTLDRPNSGEIHFENQNLLQMSEDELAQFRSEKMGFVFQFHHLLEEMTALENVALPLQIAEVQKKEAEERAAVLLQKLGLSERLKHFPAQMSGGELQRVAIARALIRSPQILFADEPTGNLDSVNGQKIQELFFELRQSMGLTLVVVTHDPIFAAKFPKVMKLKDGLWSA